MLKVFAAERDFLVLLKRGLIVELLLPDVYFRLSR